uniref:Neuronal acetylcholine receptor subunit alpha-10 n=1 Tax=Magallana gigas TaxID=29159 RepID=A0A8W8I8U4_MAGGI|nr:neuronal acetylcholine receptor subunit alpha-10 [Crassostrea gigas]|eukprot:XP_011439437.1 PREDICTED: neuronal acetylcholine receptor subunit alpha-10 [Crassostrea gigas]
MGPWGFTEKQLLGNVKIVILLMLMPGRLADLLKPDSTSEGTFYNVTYVISHNADDVTSRPVPDEQRLMNHILRGYEKAVRPVQNASTAVIVKMGLTLTQIFDMDEKNQVLVTNVWLDQEWDDEFLKWDPLQFSNVTKIRIPCHKIWLPDIVLYNNAAEYTDGVMLANAMVEHNGNVFWPIPTKLQSSCKVDVTYFPFDDQICKMKFGSWTYDGFQVDITNRSQEVDLSNYVVNGEWVLISVRVQRNVVYYTCCPESFPDVTFFIHIRRRTLYYMYNVIFPCIMMSALTLLVFCLPPDSGEKIALGITVLLAFSVFMLAVAENLPETSEFVPLISIYLTIVMSLTSVSVIMTVFVLNLHHRGPSRNAVPAWIRGILLGPIQSILCVGKNDRIPTGRQGSRFLRTMSLRATLENIAQELQNEAQLENGVMADTIVTDGQGTTLHNETRCDVRLLPNDNHQRPRRGIQVKNLHTKSHEEIVRNLQSILDKHEKEDRDYEIIQEWRKVAQVVDRILFWIFLFGTLSSTLIILVITPAVK